MRLGSRRVRFCLGVCIIMKSARVSLSVVCTLVLWAVALVSATDPFQWDSCGNKDDRLRTTALTMSSPDGKWGKGELASIDAKGDCNLNGPLKSGSWAINVYELGNAHPVDVQWGDLTKAVTFTDPKNTTFDMKVAFTMPAAQGSGHFQASLMGQDDQHASYFCLEIFFNYTSRV